MTRNRIVVTLKPEGNITCSPVEFLLYEKGNLLGTYYSEDEVTRELESIFESLAKSLGNLSSDYLISPADFERSLSSKASQEYNVIGICEEGKKISYSIKIGLAPHKYLHPEENKEDIDEDNSIGPGL